MKTIERIFGGRAQGTTPARRQTPRGGLLAAIAGGMLLLASALPVPAQAQTQIDRINTNWKLLGSDYIGVERYDDPRVPNVSCYVSRAQTGGLKGLVGVAEDPSRFSIACRAVGPVTIPDKLPDSENVWSASASILFKTLNIHRSVDRDKGVLVYTVTSTKLINGSPYNSVSAVPTR